MNPTMTMTLDPISPARGRPTTGPATSPAPALTDPVADPMAADPMAADPMAADPMAADPTAADPMAAARSAVLRAAFAALDAAGVPYCVTHNHAGLPAVIGADVDLVTTAAALAGPAPAALLDAPGLSLVQWLVDRSCWAVVAGPGPTTGPDAGAPALVQLHLSPGFEPDDVPCLSADEVMTGSTNAGGFWASSPAVEFGCVLANRVTKESLREVHAARLSALFAADPAGCEAAVRRFWTGPAAEAVLTAARSGRWAAVDPMLPLLGNALRQARGRTGGAAKRVARRLARWARPTSGMHVVFLGPDGVGKSTVIDKVKAALSPAFLRYSYQTFAPSLLPAPLQPKKDMPHQLPPRGQAASWLKAAWWSLCYTAGYLAAVRPTVARGGLVLNHRYLPDAIVDPKRYRYSGPKWVLKALWKVAPKPDLLFVLDAPAEVIQARKAEVTPAETARQRDGYRAVADGLANAHVISTHRPLAEVVAEVDGLVLATLAARVQRRVNRGAGVRLP